MFEFQFQRPYSEEKQKPESENPESESKVKSEKPESEKPESEKPELSGVWSGCNAMESLTGTVR